MIWQQRVKNIILELPLKQQLDYFFGFPELTQLHRRFEICKIACENDNVQILKHFYNSSIHCDYLLHRSTITNSVNCVYWLIQNTPVKDWNWGLTGACYSGNIHIIKLMVRNGAWDWGRGILSATQSPNCSITVIKFLTFYLKKEKCIEMLNFINIGLMYSFSLNNMDVFEYLLKIKIDEKLKTYR